MCIPIKFAGKTTLNDFTLKNLHCYVNMLLENKFFYILETQQKQD